MNIAGVLVHARPDKADQVAARLDALPGVEVHQRSDDGRLVITVEDIDETTAGERLLEIQLFEGLLSASLVYHHFDSDTDSDSSAGATADAGANGKKIEESDNAAVTP